MEEEVISNLRALSWHLYHWAMRNKDYHHKMLIAHYTLFN